MSSENNDKKTKQSCLSILIQAIILCVITTCLTFMGLPNHFFRKPRASARQKACFSNIRVITGAIEMYNMDNNIKISVVNDNMLEELVRNKYLKSLPTLPESKCEYRSEGDVSANGYVYCEYHGDIEGKKSSEYYELNNEREFRRTTIRKIMVLLLLCFGPALLLIIVNLM